MNTLEGNKLIAEFMNLEKEEKLYYHESSEYVFELSELEFHASWDWLIPCVFKIMDDTSIYAQERQRVYSSINRDISVTWQAVVKFIQWYNAQNK